MTAVGAEAVAVVVIGAGLSIKVAVVVLVLVLQREVAADKETGMLTKVPVWPLVMDKGSWMRRGWPEVIMPLPGAVFSSKVPVGAWLVMPVAKLGAALAVVAISWRIGPC